MTQEEAVELVLAIRHDLDIDEDMRLTGTEHAIVEHLADPSRPGVPESRYAWVVSLSCEWGRADVIVDEETRRVLGVERTR